MPSPFPPIADYAFLSNCHTGALVAPDGAIDWLCVPRFDAPSVFGSILDRGAGSFRLAPFGIDHPTQRTYEPGTNVLVTTWKTPSGWIEVRDALTMGPTQGEDTITPHTRPPADDDADHMLVRTVECLDGQVEIELICEPAFDYGSMPAEWALVEGGRHAADTSFSGQSLRLRSDLALGIEGNWVRARHVLESGERAFCALSWAEALATPEDVDDAMARIAATTRFWRSWLGRARIPDHRWRDPIQRSALAIKGLTYMPTGATVAALTTSLPETPGGERNWDYRYTWMRDTTFTLQALHWLSPRLGSRGVHAVRRRRRADRGRLAPDHVRDRRAQAVAGDDPRRPLRLCRRATGSHRQRCVRPAPERRLRRRARLHPAAHAQEPAPSAQALADRRDAGGVRRQGLARARSGDLGGAGRAAALCVVQAHDLGRARPGGIACRDPRRRGARREVAGDGRQRSAPTSSSTASRITVSSASTTTTDALDASTLLATSLGFLPADDERLRNTVLAIESDLTEHGFVLRYRTEETDDGLTGKEGTFLICSFWLVSALAIVGEIQRARDLMERLLRIASPLGLYAEEFDADTGCHLGNFPQAFSHLALIEAAARIIVPEKLAQY